MSRRKRIDLSFVILLLLAIAVIIAVQLPLTDPGEERRQGEIPRGADVAVMGGTTAALLAALEASNNGAQVYLFPGDKNLANDTQLLITSGAALADTPVQRDLGLIFTSRQLEEELLENGGFLNDPALVRAFILRQGEFYSWLKETFGLELDLLPWPEARPYLHLCSRAGASLSFKQNLWSKLKNSPVTVSEEKIVDLVFSPQGRLEAVLLENSRAEKTLFYVQAAILADGGYSGALTHWHRDFSPGNNFFNLRPEEEGQGLQMAAAAGAELIQMGLVNRRLLLYNQEEEEYYLLPRDPWKDSYLLNTRGEILFWEETPFLEAYHFIANSPPDGVFILAPEERALALARFFRRFEHLDELVTFYSLKTPLFFPGSPMPPPPYYAAPLKTGVDYTLGGIAVTPRGEVKKDGLALRGLYAAGEIVGGLHGEALLPGMAFSETLFLARTAGEAAAAYSRR